MFILCFATAILLVVNLRPSSPKKSLIKTEQNKVNLTKSTILIDK